MYWSKVLRLKETSKWSKASLYKFISSEEHGRYFSVTLKSSTETWYSTYPITVLIKIIYIQHEIVRIVI